MSRNVIDRTHFSSFSPEKTFAFIRGSATALNHVNTLRALQYAREKHEGQTRKSGEPYITHPLTMASHALSLGLHDDELVATLLLHDIVEDCGVSPEELPVNEDVRTAVRLLTHVKPEPLEPYYRAISENRLASFAKIFDRCHNVSTMAGAFSVEKLRQYVDETKTYSYPLITTTKHRWPEYANVMFVLRYHMHAVTDAVASCLELMESEV